MPLYAWSQVSNSNDSADVTVNWREGQSPSSVNDSARAMMAATAKYRDDIAGATNTSGISTAYTLSTFSVFDKFASLDNQIVAFTPHTTNGAGGVTLNVDGLGAKPLWANGAAIPGAMLIQGTPYTTLYNNAVGAFYLQGVYGNPYNVPLASGIDYYGGTAPNSSFAFPYGQAISRTTYATLFAIIGTTFGVGDGSTTFNLPDKRGCVSAMQDNVGGAAGRLTGAFGAIIGEQTHLLNSLEIPAHPHPITDPGHVHGPGALLNNVGGITSNLQGNISGSGISFLTTATGSGVLFTTVGAATGITVNNNTGGGGAHNNVQPTLIVNHIMRII